MTRTQPAARILLISDRRPARANATGKPLRRYRLARVALTASAAERGGALDPRVRMTD